VEALMSTAGGSGGGNSAANAGRLIVTLKPRDERANVDDVVAELRRKLARLPGITAYPQIPPAIQIGGRQSKSLYQFTMQGSDVATLYPAASKLIDAARRSSKLQDVTSDLQLNNPQVAVKIDRTRAATFGVGVDQIETSLYDAYGSRQVSTIYTPSNEYFVILELLPQYQQDISALDLLFVKSNSGRLVPLSTLATLEKTSGPVAVNHSGQLPSVTLSFNLADGVSLGEATAEVQRLAAENLPSSLTTGFSGTAQVFQSTQSGLIVLVILAVFVIYVVLGILYESFIHPITILSGIPFAAFGALLALLVTRVELSVFAFVGIILLIGIVKKNAIMMVDFALETEHKEGLAAEDSIVHAAHVRFRPIMMTTMAALVGSLPVALATGAGSESRRPLGIVVVGGLLFSQLITLYITPVIYTYLDPFNRRVAKRLAREEKTEGQLAPAAI
jgi:HAE1 family hydrophobic/amphiphilic exporter-1